MKPPSIIDSSLKLYRQCPVRTKKLHWTVLPVSKAARQTLKEPIKSIMSPQIFKGISKVENSSHISMVLPHLASFFILQLTRILQCNETYVIQMSYQFNFWLRYSRQLFIILEFFTSQPNVLISTWLLESLTLFLKYSIV